MVPTFSDWQNSLTFQSAFPFSQVFQSEWEPRMCIIHSSRKCIIHPSSLCMIHIRGRGVYDTHPWWEPCACVRLKLNPIHKGWLCPICLIHLTRWKIYILKKKLNVLLGGLRLKINTNKRQQLSAADLRKLLNSVKSSKTANAFPRFLSQKNILFKSLFQHVQINRDLFSTAVEVLFLLQGLQIHGR